MKDEFSLSFWFLFHYREVTGVQSVERPEVELGILKSQALGALRTLHAFFPGTQDFSSSPNPASSISRPEVVARVQPPGVWLRLRWRRGEAGRRWAELRRAQPSVSGRAAALRSPSRAWRAAGGRRAPTLRSPAASSLRLSPRLPRVNQPQVSTSRAGRASPSEPSLHKEAGRAPAAAYPPGELGCTLHASEALAWEQPGAPH